MLACDGNTVMLAHLSQGSVVLDVGARVAVGDPIGRVGNTGNTSEPHLHIHAVRGIHRTVEDVGYVAPPLAMTFGDRYLARNDVGRLP
jgi:murein DD-endopeptidase MepM/ murein hydrolase activator NlpD